MVVTSEPRRTNRAEPLDRLVAGACKLVAERDDVRAIHVVTDHRPTYPELLRYREQAAGWGLNLTVLGSGGVVLRRRLPARVPAARSADARAIAGPPAASPGASINDPNPEGQRWELPVVPRRRGHGGSWLGELLTMSEGTR